MPDEPIEIRPIEAGDRLTGLSIGEDKYKPLKIFIQKHAKRYEEESLARTYGAFIPGEHPKLVGYITVVCGQIVLGEGDECLLADDGLQYPYKHYPAVKIARLLVDARQRKLGIGKSLVELALGLTKDNVSPVVGCRFVVVDSKTDSVSYYQGRGFTLLDTTDNKNREEPIMFVDLRKIPAEPAP